MPLVCSHHDKFVMKQHYHSIISSPDECKSNIHSSFSPVFGLHHLLREVYFSLASNCSSLFLSELFIVSVWCCGFFFIYFTTKKSCYAKKLRYESHEFEPKQWSCELENQNNQLKEAKKFHGAAGNCWVRWWLSYSYFRISLILPSLLLPAHNHGPSLSCLQWSKRGSTWHFTLIGLGLRSQTSLNTEI